MDKEISIELLLKPLGDLYGSGTGKDSLDTADEAFVPLLLAIEQTFAREYRANRAMTDGVVLAVLDKLRQSPETEYPHEPMAQDVQDMLKAVVSLNSYSRQDVRLPLRKVKLSVNRHNKQGGTRGYLTFIDKFIPGR